MLARLFSFRRNPTDSGHLPPFIFAMFFFCIGSGVLWFNEGRIDFGRLGAESVPVTADSLGDIPDGSFVAVDGVLAAPDPLGDPGYLRPGPYLRLERTVEMYAWKEEIESPTNGTPNPSDVDYITTWQSEPADSSEFVLPYGHENPPMELRSRTFSSQSVRVGNLIVDLANLDLPKAEAIGLTPDLVVADRLLNGDYLFIGLGLLSEPRIGDLRIQYAGVPSGRRATLFAEKSGDRLLPYYYRERHRLYRAFFTDRQDALAKMGQEYRTLLWGMRVFGLIFLWIAFLLFLNPLNRLVGIVPLLERFGRVLTGVLALGMAASISLLVMGTSYLYHNPFILLILILLVVGAPLGLYLWRRRNIQVEEIT